MRRIMRKQRSWFAAVFGGELVWGNSFCHYMFNCALFVLADDYPSPLENCLRFPMIFATFVSRCTHAFLILFAVSLLASLLLSLRLHVHDNAQLL